MAIRVLLVDDRALVRAGFRALIDHADGLEVSLRCEERGATRVSRQRWRVRD